MLAIGTLSFLAGKKCFNSWKNYKLEQAKIKEITEAKLKEAQRYAVEKLKIKSAIYRDNLEMALTANEILEKLQQNGYDISNFRVIISSKAAEKCAKLFGYDIKKFGGVTYPSQRGKNVPLIVLNPKRIQPEFKNFFSTQHPSHIMIHEFSHALHFNEMLKNYPEYLAKHTGNSLRGVKVSKSLKILLDYTAKFALNACDNLEKSFKGTTLDDIHKKIFDKVSIYGTAITKMPFIEFVAELSTAKLAGRKLYVDPLLEKFYSLLKGPKIDKSLF